MKLEKEFLFVAGNLHTTKRVLFLIWYTCTFAVLTEIPSIIN
jgi:hypothetical protein